MKAMSPKLVPALALLAVLSGPACAQTSAPNDAAPPSAPGTAVPPTAEQAALLEHQVRAWLSDMMGGLVALPDGIVRFAPEDGGYRITIALGVLPQVDPKDAVITAKAHMLDATRWSIDEETLPPGLKVTTRQQIPDLPAADSDPDQRRGGPGGKQRAEPLKTHLETVTYELKLGQRTASGVFDPTYSTASNTQGALSSLDLVQTGGLAATISHIGPITSVSSVTPSGDRRVDTLIDSSLQNYETKTAIPGDGPSVTLTVERVHVVGALAGLAVDKLAPLVKLLVAAGAAGPVNVAGDATPPKAAAAPKPPVPPKAPAAPPGVAASDTDRQRANFRALLVAADGLLTGGKIEETLDGIVFDASGHDGTVQHAAVSFDGAAPGDMLTASMGLTIDGLAVADLPPALAPYLPSHFVIHPTVSNLNMAALTKLGMDVTGPGGRAPEADYAVLFQNGGINVGFDALALNLADAAFTGSGSFNMSGPQTVTGQAEISAHGLEALITRAQGDPVLAQAVPVLIFLKGIAKTSPDQAVWQVSVSNGKTLINGVDVMAMMGGMAR